MRSPEPPRTSTESTTRFQTQAVLRRRSQTDSLTLVGVTLDKTFFPNDADAGSQDGEPLTLTKGLVALAPLSSVDAVDATDAAVTANADARESWKGLEPGTRNEPPTP